MTRTFKVEHHVAAPPDRTFAVFSDFKNVAARVSGIKHLEVLTSGPIGKGTRFKETRVMMGKDATEEMTITAFEPGRSYTTEAASCGCSYKAIIDFLPDSKGTRVVMAMSATPHSFFAKLLFPLTSLMMSAAMKKCTLQDFIDLGTVAETESGTASAAGNSPTA